MMRCGGWEQGRMWLDSGTRDEAFPWVEGRKSRRDEEKPWLDNGGFRELVREKGELYSRKVRGLLDDEGQQRLAGVYREVNAMRRRLKRDYFDRRMGEIAGDLRRTWEVLGEVIRGRRGRMSGAACGYFKGNGVGVTDGAEIAEGFCDFYCKVGP